MANLNQLWARAIIDTLHASGVRQAVICPGSRSTPLALALVEDGRFETQVVIDERSAGFVALGIGLATGRPAAVLATSGTAGAHFYPALIEAAMAHVPFVAITADRPWELHGFGAPQTMPQGGLYGRFPLEAIELGLPEKSEPAFAHLRALVSRAGAAAGKGPVHLNVPFREPLAPVDDGAPHELGVGNRGRIEQLAAEPVPSQAALSTLRERLLRAERGLIVCGPRARDDGFREAVVTLARGLGFAVLAEAASNARSAEVVTQYDALVRLPFADSHKPQVVLRFGGGLTSKRLQEWLDASGAEHFLVHEQGAIHDFNHRAAHLIEADAAAFCRALASGLTARQSRYAQDFAEAEAAALSALEAAFAGETHLTEPRIAREVSGALQHRAQLFVSSSMPVRDVDAFGRCGESLRVFSNRGVNGIDGVISSAIGAAIGTQRPTVALVGDLAFLHDLGALVTARRAGVPLTIVVVNNDGGGIFSFLPIAKFDTHFEKLFGTPHGLTMEHAAALVEARYERPATAEALRSAIAGSLGSTLSVIEVTPVSRQQNVAAHQSLQSAIAQAVAGGKR